MVRVIFSTIENLHYLGSLHGNFTENSMVVLENNIWKTFGLYVSMLKSEPFFKPQYWSGGNSLNSLDSTLSAVACIVISQVVEL